MNPRKACTNVVNSNSVGKANNTVLSKEEIVLSRLDSWLLRGSYLSQIGLLLISIWSIYFVVIPIFQRDLLQEEIAEKEIQLQQLKKDIDAAYFEIRKEILHNIVLAPGAECSGLMINPPNDEEIMSGENFSKKTALDIDPEECINASVNHSGQLERLKVEDGKLLKSKLELVVKKLSPARLVAINQKDNLKTSSPEVLDHIENFTNLDHNHFEMMRRLGSSEEQVRNYSEKMALNRAISDVEHSYGQKVRNELSKLREITWKN